MTHLLHLIASPRGGASISRRLSDEIVAAWREANPDGTVDTWDLWDGTLPAFDAAAAGAKMAVFGGADMSPDQQAAWAAALAAFERLRRADRIVTGVPMWNGGVPYILKQFIDVVSQPGAVFGVDAQTGYEHLLAGQGRRAISVYTSAVWAPHLGPEFGTDFQSTYYDDWLRWIGIEDRAQVRFAPGLTGDAEAALAEATAQARALGDQL